MLLPLPGSVGKIYGSTAIWSIVIPETGLDSVLDSAIDSVRSLKEPSNAGITVLDSFRRIQ